MVIAEQVVAEQAVSSNDDSLGQYQIWGYSVQTFEPSEADAELMHAPLSLV
jgi:hypothetical protein